MSGGDIALLVAAVATGCCIVLLGVVVSLTRTAPPEVWRFDVPPGSTIRIEIR